MDQLFNQYDQYTYVRIAISVPNPTVSGTVVEANAALDRAYNKIIGVAFHEIADGGVTNNYRVGFRTDRKEWVPPVNISNWNADSGVPVMGKYRTFGKQGIGYAQGDNAYVTIIPGANTSAAMSGELVIVCARDNEEVPRM